MSLPKWIYSNEAGRDLYQREVDLQAALELAWSVLEHLKANEEISPEMGVASDLARECMRRIEALGK